MFYQNTLLYLSSLFLLSQCTSSGRKDMISNPLPIESSNLQEPMQKTSDKILEEKVQALKEMEKGFDYCQRHYPITESTEAEKEYLQNIEKLPEKLKRILEKQDEKVREIHSEFQLKKGLQLEESDEYDEFDEEEKKKINEVNALFKKDARKEQLEVFMEKILEEERPFFKPLPKQARIYHLVMGNGPTLIGSAEDNPDADLLGSGSMTTNIGSIMGSGFFANPSAFAGSALSANSASGLISGGLGIYQGHSALVIGSMELDENDYVRPTQGSLFFSFPNLWTSWEKESPWYKTAHILRGPRVDQEAYQKILNNEKLASYFVDDSVFAAKHSLQEYAHLQGWIANTHGSMDVQKVKSGINSSNLPKKTKEILLNTLEKADRYYELKSKKLPFGGIPNNCSDGSAACLEALAVQENTLRGYLLTIPLSLQDRLTHSKEWEELTVHDKEIYFSKSQNSYLSILRRALFLSSEEYEKRISSQKECYSLIQVATFTKLSYLEMSSEILKMIKGIFEEN